MPKHTTLAATFIACLGSATLGFENRPGLTGANITTVAGNKFGPSLQNNLDRAILNKGNSLEKTDYIVTKFDIAKAVLGPSPRDLSQHVSKPATPEQREAYIRKNKKELIIASFLGITFGNQENSMAFIVENTNGEIKAVQSAIVGTPRIPQYMEIDPQVKRFMSEIYNSKEFNELKEKRIEWIEEKFGPIIGPQATEDYYKLDEKLKNFLGNNEVTPDKTSIKEESPKNSPPSQQICQKEIENSSRAPGVQEEKKPLTSITKLSDNTQRLYGKNTTVVEL